MKKLYISLTVSLLFVFTAINVFAQGLPPGWDYVATPSTHIISVPLECEPDINGWPIEAGDWIGVFYLDDDGNLSCGGAAEWYGDENTGIIAFGDDSFTAEKDGFDIGETMNYVIYSWAVQKEYPAVVTCDPSIGASCTVFGGNVLSGVATMDASGFYAVIEASQDSICLGDMVQLNAIPSGGSGTYSYNWYSDPAGFNSAIANPTVTPQQNTKYFVDIQDADELISLSVDIYTFNPPEANAGNDQIICENQNAQMNATVNYQSAVQWSTSGDGSFSDPQVLNPEYIPGSNDISSGIIVLEINAEPIEPCTLAATSQMNLYIIQLPLVNAGEDQLVCETDVVVTAPDITNVGSLLWTTSGDGTFEDPNYATTNYYPGTDDLQSGTVTLTVTANAMTPCVGTETDDFTVAFSYLPEVTAGDNQFICENETVQLDGLASNYETFLWTSSGDGFFDDAGLLNAVYTPGSNDISAGSLMLTLSAQSISPCSESVSDELSVFITPEPTVNAGDDATICENEVHQLSGTATNYDEVQWTSSGDGSFWDPNLLTSSYTPGQQDIINGVVTLSLTANPEFPCTLQADDQMILVLQSLPLVDAGTDETICEGQTMQTNASAMNFQQVSWTTSGDGIFDDPNALMTLYIPGTGDIQNGNVQLVLLAEPLFPCVLDSEDMLVLNIQLMPVIDAGEDVSVCEDSNIELTATAQNYESVTWQSSGDGILNNPNSLNTVYEPGPEDISNGGTTLTITALPVDPCTLSMTDELYLTVVWFPESYAGEDATISSGETLQLNGEVSNQTLIIWSSSGDGSFNFFDILNPVYTPGQADIQQAGATITLTAFPESPCIVSAEDELLLTIDTITAVRETVAEGLKVYPNPVRDELFLQVPNDHKIQRLEIISLEGRTVLSKNAEELKCLGESHFSLQLEQLKPAIYLVRIHAGSKIITYKIKVSAG